VCDHSPNKAELFLPTPNRPIAGEKGWERGRGRGKVWEKPVKRNGREKLCLVFGILTDTLIFLDGLKEKQNAWGGMIQ